MVHRSIKEKLSNKVSDSNERGSADYSSVVHEKAILKASAKSSVEDDTKSHGTR